MKSLVLRFDIDTYKCIKQGVPNLLRLAREEQVAFTFFCNMGRAIYRPVALKRLLRSPRGDPDGTRKLSIRAKLGFNHMLLTLLCNPRVGMSSPNIVRQIEAQGHDLGLHGGRNHGDWQNAFKMWPDDRIRKEVSTGRAMFKRVLHRPPVLFSSPGWQGSGVLDTILQQMGFEASADRHGPAENEILCDNGFCTLPTNLVGEPGGVAYFESLAARGYSGPAVTETLLNTLDDDRQLYVLYDHPCFAGVDALEAVRHVVRSAVERGVEVTTYSAIMQRLRDGQ